jgi:hypothetical protein
MNKNLIYTSIFSAGLFLFSCKDTDTKAIQMTEDTTASGSGGGAKKAGAGGDSAGNISGGGSGNSGSSEKDSLGKMPAVQSVGDNTKIKAPAKMPKKKPAAKDSTAPVGTADNDNLPAARKATIAKADNSKPVANTSSIAGKAFVSKYGTIPRNTTTDNINEFLIAFPDKTILIKINYNADPDTEMQAVKAQVVKVLKKSGYSNISDQSLTLHPMHVPKDIHYELQHDESVVIWIPPATAE